MHAACSQGSDLCSLLDKSTFRLFTSSILRKTSWPDQRGILQLPDFLQKLATALHVPLGSAETHLVASRRLLEHPSTITPKPASDEPGLEPTPLPAWDMDSISVLLPHRC